MPLYRCDFVDAEGKITGPVTNAYMKRMPFSGDVLTRHMATIRPIASEAAHTAGRDVAIQSITGAGRMRVVLIATPDGRFRRPDKTKSAGTNADHKTDGPCFCTACRADRRASRAKGGNR